jgi:hypothetical protein
MRALVLGVLVCVLLTPGSARAERLFWPGDLVFSVREISGMRKLVTSPSEWPSFSAGGRTGSAAFANRQGVAPGTPSAVYSRAFSALVVTRDLVLPGMPFLGVRLIPTRRALGGESQIPIVFRPLVIGAGSVGLDATARF